MNRQRVTDMTSYICVGECVTEQRMNIVHLNIYNENRDRLARGQLHFICWKAAVVWRIITPL